MKKPRKKKPARKTPLRSKRKGSLSPKQPKRGKKGFSKAKKEMEKSLNGALKKLQSMGYEGRILLHERDTYIDGELRMGIARGDNPRRVMLDIERVFSAPRGQWISTGYSYVQRKKEENRSPMPRMCGKAQAGSFYQNTSKAATNFVTARTIDKFTRKRGYRKAESAFLRLHWNSLGKVPKRRGTI